MSTFPAELTGTWQIDAVHSTVGFAAKHAMVATTRGRFETYTGGATIDVTDVDGSSLWVDIDAASVSTGNEQRDGHLKSADFFHVEQHPRATFRSTRVEQTDEEHAKVYGDLTIRGVTRPVVLDVEFEGQGKDAYGNQRAGFTATTAIDRLDYGIKWNPALETGGFVVSNRVKLTLHISAVKQS